MNSKVFHDKWQNDEKGSRGVSKYPEPEAKNYVVPPPIKSTELLNDKLAQKLNITPYWYFY